MSAHKEISQFSFPCDSKNPSCLIFLLKFLSLISPSVSLCLWNSWFLLLHNGTGNWGISTVVSRGDLPDMILFL